jgi:pectate lyase
MKFLALASLLALTAATPTPTQPESGTARIAKRATISDKATLGYATLNGGYVIRGINRSRAVLMCLAI